MMHKCIIVKVGGSKKRKLKAKKHKLNKNRGNFINFVKIGGNMQYASLTRGGMDAPAYDQFLLRPAIVLLQHKF